MKKYYVEFNPNHVFASSAGHIIENATDFAIKDKMLFVYRGDVDDKVVLFGTPLENLISFHEIQEVSE